MCPVKQICKLHYLFATKLIQSLKKVPGKNPADWRYKGKQTSHRGDASAPSQSPSSTTLHGNIIENVVKFEKKLAKQIENYQGKYLKFTSVRNNEPIFECILYL